MRRSISHSCASHSFPRMHVAKAVVTATATSITSSPLPLSTTQQRNTRTGRAVMSAPLDDTTPDQAQVTAPIFSVPWSRLRAWIDEKEAWEKQHQRPAPLSNQELAAISQLVPLSNEEPSVGDRDYISDLMRYIQGKRISAPAWSEDSVRALVDGHMMTRWRVFCTLHGVEGKFPREGYGAAAGGEAPSFQSKKKAKQYASQQALAFLASRKRPDNLNSPITPSTPSGKRLYSSETPSPRLAKKAKEPSIFEHVQRLTKEMGMDSPSYQLFPDEELPEFWSGRAVFRPGSKFPKERGVVRQVLSKQDAKDQVAQRVLAWLGEEKEKREADLAFLLALGRGGGTGENDNRTNDL